MVRAATAVAAHWNQLGITGCRPGRLAVPSASGRSTVGYLVAASLLGWTGSAEAAKPVGQLDRNAFLNDYCVACHSGAAPAGNLELEGIPTQDAAASPQVWEKVVRRLGAGEMPPPGAARPEPSASYAFRNGLMQDLDAAARRSPHAGQTVVRRLNRLEYANAVRDLLAVEIPVAGSLPPDGQAAGFDNIADALAMSPLLLERYLKVARRVSQLALGVSDPSPVTEIFRAEGTQALWQGEGMPYGSRGGIRVNHHFPHDGEYELRAFLEKQSLTPTEGVRFFRTRVRLSAGPHVVIVTFPDEFAAREGPVLNVSGSGGRALGGPLDLLGTAIRPTIDFRVDGQRVKIFEIAGMTSGESAFDGMPGPPALGRIEITGPYEPGGGGETPSRKRVLICTPAGRDDETRCASRILATVTRRAFRRDIGQTDLRPLMSTFASTRETESFEASIAAAIRAVLLAPDFLFRLEFDRPGRGATRNVSNFELASRLSFFLWSSIPDDELLDTASSGTLTDPPVLERQARRMLADPRAATLASNFASQWLGLRNLGRVRPDREAYPHFDAALLAAFRAETRLFLRSVIRENRSVLDILGGEYTYVNERLARHYGIPGVVGPGFRRVSLAGNPQRGGLLGQGSILLLTSHAAKTSPVLRGTWILDRLLNSPPPPPPANVPPLDETQANGRSLTNRQQVELHRADPGCASCHDRIDPLGFALENYDVIGRWRTQDGEESIDASGALPSGEEFTGPAGLRKLLLGHPQRFAGATVERLLTFALGRELGPRDQPTVRQVLRETEDGGYRFKDLIVAIVRSAPFRMRQASRG